MSLLTVLIASLLGSPHCAGMCGGFAVFCGGQDGNSYKILALYNLGRLLTYLALGIVAGLIGGAIDDVGFLLGFGQGAAVVLGVVLVVWGITRFFPSLRKFSLGFGLSSIESTGGWYRAVLKRVGNLHPSMRSLTVGISSTLLPCGWLYSYAAVAGTRGNVPEAMLVMLIFWLGTLPMMLSIGGFSRQIIARWGEQLPYVTAALLIAAGFFSIFSHLGSGVGMECQH